MLKKVICIFIAKLYVANRPPKALLLEDSGRVDMRYIAFQHELSSQLPGSDSMVQEFSGEIHTQENLKENFEEIGILGLLNVIF